MGSEEYPQTVALRDETEVTILPLQPCDLEELQAFYLALPEEERMVFRFDINSPEWGAHHRRYLESGEVISLIARRGDDLVAEATLTRSLRGWSRHVGEIRIACHESVRRQGLGTTLAGDLVKIATELGIEKIVAHVVETQVGARRTFEKLGFRKDAVLTKHVMDLHGAKRDLIILANDVTFIWAAMESLKQD